MKKKISKKKSKKNVKKFQKKKIKKKKLKKLNFTKIIFNISPPPPHTICIVSHSSYHTRRITLVVSHSHDLPRYFRWNMMNIGAINITLVYDNIGYTYIDTFFDTNMGLSTRDTYHITHSFAALTRMTWLCHSFIKPITKCNPCNNLLIVNTLLTTKLIVHVPKGTMSW